MDINELVQSEEFQCPTCNKIFTVHTKFNKHLETHNLTCAKCNIRFKTYHQKRLHDRSCHSPVQKKDKTCRICPGASFKTEEEYLLHVRDIHKGKLIDCYMCNVCGKTFKTRSELRQHINSKCGTEKLFTCKVCGQKLMSAGSLYNHMRRHSDMASFMCRFCAKLFHTAGQLKVHERIHTQQKDFVCDVCGKGFCHRQSLITHSTVHTGIKPYQCEGCGKSFSCVGNLLKHRKSHADTCGLLPLTTHRVQNPSTKIKVKINTPLTSKLKEVQRNKELQEKLAKLDSLNASMKSVATRDEIKEKSENDPATTVNQNDSKSEDTYENHDIIKQNASTNVDLEENNCKIEKTDDGNKVNSETRNGNEIVNEENDSSSDNSTEASDESRLSSRPKNRGKRKRDTLFEQKLNEFIKDRQLENKKAASCKYCKKEYTIFRWLYRHEQEHAENGEGKILPFKCSCCKKCFETKDDLKHHQQLDHADILSCHDCGDKIFANPDSLRSHRHIFHKGVPRKEYVYICEKCGKKFKQKTVLQMHNETNCSKGLFFQCDVCRKEFSSDHTRKAHMRVHSSEKNLTCKFCGKGFHWKGQLKVHERSHTGEKPYTCLFCPSAFAYRDSLITHSTLHTGIKPYFCKGCGWRFSCIGNLVKHKVTHANTCGAWYQKNEKEDCV
ncbi:zinc finger protein 62 homolog [Anoplophora glabripennis]|uniref:zinc finger protein 62 homolog n=1 Tax=Anoplophora glabripennis TaxID=217634 RepID=UPI000873D62E|nr:zinc finger protein 62 homolog [Anoplophora glabripennis]